MKIKFKNKKQFFTKLIVLIAGVGLLLTTFLPFISLIFSS